MKTAKTNKIAVAAGMAMMCLSGHVVANLIVVQPTSYTSDLSFGPADATVTKTIDGTGLSDPSIVETGDAVPVTLPTEGASSWENGARWSGGTEIVYNLGGAYDLEDVLFWNYGESGETDRGIKSVTASFSTDGSVFTGATGLNFAEGIYPNMSGETVNLQASGVDPSDLSDVTHVKFTDFVNHSDPAGSDGLKGYGEIRFTAVVPEPSTLAMFGLGLGILATARRRMGRK